MPSPLPFAYLTVILIWSTTPLAIQWSALGGGFTFAVLARMAIGLALSLTIIVVWRVGLPLHARALRSYLAGGLGTFGAMLCTYWGAQYIHSGLVSVLFGLAPLITAVLSAVWLGEKTLQPARLAGLLLALGGLALIFATGGTNGQGTALYGLAALLLAVLIYCAALVWMKRIGDDSPPLATTAGTLLVSVPLFALAWLLLDGHVPVALPTRALLAIGYLGVFGSVLGFALYYYLIKHMEAGKVALITLVTPVIALLIGRAFNHEAIEARVWVGAGLISLGLALHQWRSITAAMHRRGG